MRSHTTQTLQQTAIYVSDVIRLRNWLRVGDIVKAEVHHVTTVDRSVEHNDFGTEPVEILEKYPNFAMTNRGAITWNNIAIHNKDLVRRSEGK